MDDLCDECSSAVDVVFVETRVGPVPLCAECRRRYREAV